MPADPETPEIPEAEPEWNERPERHERVPEFRELPDPGIYREFRHLVASRRMLDGYFATLAQALRFCGEVRVEFNDGQVVWTELREMWVDWPAIGGKLGDE